MILPEQRVTEHLKQLALQDEPPLGHRLLLPGDVPQTSVRHAGRPGQPLYGRRLAEVDEGKAGHGGAYNLPFELQRRSDDRQAIRGSEDDGWSFT